MGYNEGITIIKGGFYMMNADSEMCRRLLKRGYPVKNDIERLAIEVLKAEPEDVVDIPGITDMDDNQIDELAETIRRIRKDIGAD
jgi:hypothetical protein